MLGCANGPEYSDILHHHQTPASLVQAVSGKPPRFDPGGPAKGEEHSAYNLLALIVEKATGLSFAAGIDELVFKPLKMSHSGIDDDHPPPRGTATGYIPSGVRDLAQAEPGSFASHARRPSGHPRL
jgi:D-alanyl-D-alanine carboxypeptidase